MNGNTPLVFVNNSMETFTPTQSGAIATYIYECCRAAADSGVEPLVVSRDSPAAPFSWDRLILLHYPGTLFRPMSELRERALRKVFGIPRLGMVMWAWRVAAALRRGGCSNATLLLQNDPELAVGLRLLLPRATIVHLFQNQLEARPPWRRVFRSAVDAVAAVSNFTADWIAGYYGVPAGEVRTVYSGVDADTFRPPADRNGRPVIGFVGRTGIEKAPDLLLTAALQLSNHTTAFELQLVGSNHWDRFENDDYQKSLTSLAERLEAKGVPVTRPGHIRRSELPSWLGRSWVHVVPSRWDEPFGLTTLEGMAAGNAVVASASGGTPEVVGDGGLLFSRDDSADLADKLKRLLDSPAELQRWASRARDRAERFPWKKTYAALASMCQEATLQRRGGAAR